MTVVGYFEFCKVATTSTALRVSRGMLYLLRCDSDRDRIRGNAISYDLKSARTRLDS